VKIKPVCLGLSLLAVFVLGALVSPSSRHSRHARAPAAAARPAALEDELSAIAKRHAEADDAVHQAQLTDAEKAELWESNRRHRMAEMGGAYARHGRELPGAAD
jgi:hypothetical protein